MTKLSQAVKTLKLMIFEQNSERILDKLESSLEIRYVQYFRTEFLVFYLFSASYHFGLHLIKQSKLKTDSLSQAKTPKDLASFIACELVLQHPLYHLEIIVFSQLHGSLLLLIL